MDNTVEPVSIKVGHKGSRVSVELQGVYVEFDVEQAAELAVALLKHCNAIRRAAC